MDNYLLTWYGVTDLRSSLGLEPGSGPILGALLSFPYTHIKVLGYTRSEKIVLPEGYDSIVEFGKNNFDKFINTQLAHDYFISWLQQKIQEYHLPAQVEFFPAELRKLNDTEKIYELAKKVLSSVCLNKNEKEVTLFLSPGTPVMAFTWAFTSLKFPEIKIKLIASSNPRLSPEQIVLPNEWLEWYGIEKNNAEKEYFFDVIVHLFGEQRLPSYLGMKQFQARRHIFVTTKKFPANSMKRFLDKDAFQEIIIDGFDPKNMYEKLYDVLKSHYSGKSVGFNLTGGTKLMYSAAFNVCKKISGVPFYFDSHNNDVLFLNDYSRRKTKLIKDVREIISLNAEFLTLKENGKSENVLKNIEEHKKLTKFLWENKEIVNNCYSALFQNWEKNEFAINKLGLKIEYLKNKHVTVNYETKDFIFDKWEKEDFLKYITGGWFEDYVYLALKEDYEHGLIYDLRVRMEFSLEDEKEKKLSSFRDLFDYKKSYHEFDITFTNGKCLYIIDCKSGKIQSSDVEKLSNTVRQLGGVEGKGILVSCFDISDKVVKHKTNDAKNIDFVYGNNVIQRLKERIVTL